MFLRFKFTLLILTLTISAQTLAEEATCPVHKVNLERGVQQINYGIDGPEMDHPQLYPLARTARGGGCVVSESSPKEVEVMYCPICRKVRAEKIANRTELLRAAKTTIDEKEIDRLLRSDEISILSELVMNPYITTEQLLQLHSWSKDTSAWTKRVGDYNPPPYSSSDSTSIRLAVITGIAKNQRTPPEILREILVNDENDTFADYLLTSLITAIAGNPNTPPELLTTIREQYTSKTINFSDSIGSNNVLSILRALASNPKSSATLLDDLAKITAGSSYDSEIERSTAQARLRSIYSEVAHNPSTTDQTLGYLLETYANNLVLSRSSENLERLALISVNKFELLIEKFPPKEGNVGLVICRGWHDPKTAQRVRAVMEAHPIDLDCSKFRFSDLSQRQ